MSAKTFLPDTNQAEHSLFITTRPSRNTQMPDASQKIAARRMIERAWAEEHGMDVPWLMEGAAGSGTSTTCQTHYPPNGGMVSDDNDTDNPPPPGPTPIGPSPIDPTQSE